MIYSACRRLTEREREGFWRFGFDLYDWMLPDYGELIDHLTYEELRRSQHNCTLCARIWVSLHQMESLTLETSQQSLERLTNYSSHDEPINYEEPLKYCVIWNLDGPAPASRQSFTIRQSSSVQVNLYARGGNQFQGNQSTEVRDVGLREPPTGFEAFRRTTQDMAVVEWVRSKPQYMPFEKTNQTDIANTTN
ncbi:MAG: hypothetical protein MMC23_005976 [Stictis urceolatum]|nr:hypothetical protein [Stictis urceolata]